MNDLRRTRRHGRRPRPGWLPLPLASLAAAAASVLLAGSGSAAAADECPSSNPPNMLTVAAGSPQTAQLGKAFQTNLQVALANSNGCPVTGQLGGIAVDFNAPASGASGIFASSGTHRVTLGTDATGVATAPIFTANDTAGSYSVQADSAYGSVQLHLTNTATGVPATIAATGREQSATVNSQYSQPLRAQVMDANGRPVQGVSVSFALATGATGAGASFPGGAAQAEATTNASGQAISPPFVANATRGRFTATASIADIAAVATFRLNNRAGGITLRATRLAQTAAVERRYRRPLQARVLDATGQPIEGASVTFKLPEATSGAGASFVGGESQASAVTNANGRASSPPLVANKTAGRFTATATLTGTSTDSSSPTSGIANLVSYALRNLAGAPATISAGGASGQSTPAGTRFPIRLAVTVTDTNNNRVAGALVTFTAPARGPSGRFRPRARRIVRVKTNHNGVAIAPAFTANRTPGGYVVTATAGGRRTAFALINRPRR
jgi:protocatechuate 3,4-dioxygenase beta subunit